MIDRPHSRLLALLVLFCVLFVLLVGAGTLTPDPAMNQYPDHYDLGTDYGSYEGGYAEISGTVIETDPVVIEAEYDVDRALVLTVTNVEEPVEVGQRLRVYGIVQPGGTINAHETVVVSPWETYYAWVVSFVAGLWVLVRFRRGWRFDRSTLSFHPTGAYDA